MQELVHQHLLCMYREVMQAEGKTPTQAGGFTQIMAAGSAWPNFVMETQVGISPDTDELEQLLHAVRQGKAPRYWWVVPSLSDAGLPAELMSLGWMPVAEYPCLAKELEIQSLEVEQSFPATLKIEVVKSGSGLKQWVQLAGATFGTLSLDLFTQLAAQPNFTFFLGNQNGQPVATSMAYCHEHVVAVHHVNTASSHRKQGIGSAMFQWALQHGAAKGANLGITQSTAAGLSAWQALGMSPVGNMQLFWVPHEA